MDAVIDPILVPAAPPKSGGQTSPAAGSDPGPSFAEHLSAATEGEKSQGAEAPLNPQGAPIAPPMTPQAQPAITIQLAAAPQPHAAPSQQPAPLSPAIAPVTGPTSAASAPAPAASPTAAPETAMPVNAQAGVEAHPESAPPPQQTLATPTAAAAQSAEAAPRTTSPPSQPQQQSAATPLAAEQAQPAAPKPAPLVEQQEQALAPPVADADEQMHAQTQLPPAIALQQIASQQMQPAPAQKPQENAAIDTAKARAPAQIDPNAKAEPKPAEPDAKTPASAIAPAPAAKTAAPQAGASETALKAAALADTSSAPPPAPQQTRAATETAQAEPARAAALPAAQQVAREIVRRFNGGATQFEIRLDPPELGRVEVRMEVSRDNRVTAIVTADTPAALSELARGARDITQALQSAGLDLSENGLSFDLAQRGEREAAQEAAGGRSGAGRQTEEANAPQAPARLIGLERWRGVRVDLVA